MVAFSASPIPPLSPSFQSYQGPPAGRPGPGGAGEAMFSGNDPAFHQIRWPEGLDVIRRPVVHRKAEGQVEVAVIERPIPTHADLMATHKPRYGLLVKGLPEKVQIILLLVLPAQLRSKSSQGHIGDGEKTGESDPEAAPQFAPVVLFKRRLRRG